MKFVNQEHENFFITNSEKGHGKDYKALVYTLGIDDMCRQHFSELYNADTETINTKALTAGWQTGASRRITRLAFHLFTWEIPECENDSDYTVKALFESLDDLHREGALLAIKYFA